MFCPRCSEIVAAGHACPPPWRVRVDGLGETTVRAATAESAAAQAVEQLDDDDEALAAPVRARVWPEGHPDLALDFEVRAAIEYVAEAAPRPCRCGAQVVGDVCRGDASPPRCGRCRHALSHGTCPQCQPEEWLRTTTPTASKTKEAAGV